MLSLVFVRGGYQCCETCVRAIMVLCSPRPDTLQLARVHDDLDYKDLCPGSVGQL